MSTVVSSKTDVVFDTRAGSAREEVWRAAAGERPAPLTSLMRNPEVQPNHRYWLFAVPRNARLISWLAKPFLAGAEIYLVSPILQNRGFDDDHPDRRMSVLVDVATSCDLPTSERFWKITGADFISYLVTQFWKDRDSRLRSVLTSHPAYPVLSFLKCPHPDDEEKITPEQMELMAVIITQLQDPAWRSLMTPAGTRCPPSLRRRAGLTTHAIGSALKRHPADSGESRLDRRPIAVNLLDLWAGIPPQLVGHKYLPHNFLWPPVEDADRSPLSYVYATEKLLKCLLACWDINAAYDESMVCGLLSENGYFSDSIVVAGFERHWKSIAPRCHYPQ